MATSNKKDPIYVYRVENTSKIGPYHANLWTKLWMYGKDKLPMWKMIQRSLPSFTQDFTNLGSQYSSAVLREADLSLWFKGFYEILDKEGYHISTYLTDDYVIGKSGTQVAFNLLTAKQIGRRKLL